MRCAQLLEREDGLRGSGVQTQATGAAGDDGNLALQGEERGEIFQDSFSHCELVCLWDDDEGEERLRRREASTDFSRGSL